MLGYGVGVEMKLVFTVIFFFLHNLNLNNTIQSSMNSKECKGMNSNNYFFHN